MNNAGTQPTRKVLFVSYFFPPGASVGAVRARKFVKYLPEFGWQPTVIAAADDRDDPSNIDDPTLLHDLPDDLEVIRVAPWRNAPVRNLGFRWAPTLWRPLLQAVRRIQPDVVVMTGGPFLQMALGPLLRLRTSVPYVLDLRDPWSFSKHGGDARGALLDALNATAEPAALAAASGVVTVAQAWAELYQHHYPRLGDKLTVIENGYDPDDLERLDNSTPVRADEMVYTGKFGTMVGLRDPSALLQALAQLNRTDDAMRLCVYGPPEPELDSLFADTAANGLYSFGGMLPYNEALQQSASAGINLLIGTSTGTEITTKFYEYLGTGRPLLALVQPDSELARKLRDVPFARIAPVDDADAIAEAIRQLRQVEPAEVNNRWALPYSRRTTAQQLAQLLDQVVEG